MITTNLILIDGISGSGKSTMAHFIARQMEKNGINVRWYHEEETGHPLRHSGDFKDQDEEIRAKDDFVLHSAENWQKFAEANVANKIMIESFPFEFRFNSNGNGNIDSMGVTKSRMFFEVGMRFEKVN